MSEALQLFPLPPTLTPRQQRALDAIQAAGWDGLASDDLGAFLHQHPDDGRCEFCGTAGSEVGKALRAKQLVKQRRVTAPGRDTYMVWVVVDAKPEAKSSPYSLPEGF